MLRDFDKEVDLLRNAMASNVSALMEGPQFQLREPSSHSLFRSDTAEAISDAISQSTACDQHVTQDELRRAVSALRQTIEEQQKLQKEQLSTFMAQWEKRFSILETAVSSGLKLTTNTAVSMNERSSKFLRFGEALEGVVDRVVRDGKGLSEISHIVDKLRSDVDRLGRDIEDESAERRKELAEVVGLRSSELLAPHHGVAQSADGGNHGGAGDATGGQSSEPTPHPQLDARITWALKEFRSEVSRMSHDFTRESANVRQLSRTVQSTSVETVSLREQLDAMHKQMLKFSRDLLGTQEEASGVSGAGLAEVTKNKSAVDSTSCDGRVDLLAQAYRSQLSSSGPEEESALRNEARPKGWSSPGGSRRRSSSLRGPVANKRPDTILEEECFGSLFAVENAGKGIRDSRADL